MEGANFSQLLYLLCPSANQPASKLHRQPTCHFPPDRVASRTCAPGPCEVEVATGELGGKNTRRQAGLTRLAVRQLSLVVSRFPGVVITKMTEMKMCEWDKRWKRGRDESRDKSCSNNLFAVSQSIRESSCKRKGLAILHVNLICDRATQRREVTRPRIRCKAWVMITS